ncbi:MAG: iron ABC transporter permease [Pseudomonadota bacterium]
MAFLGLVVASAAASLIFGYRTLSLSDIGSALFDHDPFLPAHVVFTEIRLPRVLAACLAGLALGWAGALMQIMTRNPLADPGILGVNAGAALGVVLAIVLFGVSDPARYVWSALVGCVFVSAIVFLLGGRQNTNPTRLLIAGAAMMAVCLASIRAILLLNRQTLDTYRFWVLGGLDGAAVETIQALLPFLLAGAALAVVASRWLNALALGSDVARGLGVRIRLVQVTTALAIVLLCGATVSMVGPIGFVGLVSAHVARPFARADATWHLLLSGLAGMTLILVADLLGRLPLLGGGLQAGVLSAILGGPLLIWMIWRGRLGRT